MSTSTPNIELDLANQALINGLVAEASAGTGKTYSVAALLVRELATKEDLRISEVLVTTFTRTAAAELRDRIRGAAIDMCEQLRNNQAKKDDVVAQYLISTFQHDIVAMIQRLERALVEFDSATISTIHSVCTKILHLAGISLGNVGEEDIKGNELVKQTAELLRADHAKGLLNFYGNVEGNDIFEGTTDIVVCDGFVGNVTLKSAEGLGRLIKGVLKSELSKGWINMLGAIIAQRALKQVSRRLNPSRYNGASLLGLRGLVFKSHGGEDAYGFEWAIRRAYDAAHHDVLARIEKSIAELMPQTAAAPETNL